MLEPERSTYRWRSLIAAGLSLALAVSATGCTSRPDPKAISSALTIKAVKAVKRDDMQTALKLLHEAIYLNRDNNVARLARANILLLHQEYEKALADYDRVLQVHKRSIPAYYGRGICHYSLRDYRRARDDFDRVIELNPEYAEAYLGRAKTYERLGMKDLAERDMRRYRRLRTD
ncbi:MAG: tetratricopeptide repeat protein [Proteobacteria bacterium]|nr:tetratricopeptide repeat protein [Pseudomonadota bacterium]MBU1741859.1 tetratricopeptide repeat protein [Pseudomonadota bacterium]